MGKLVHLGYKHACHMCTYVVKTEHKLELHMRNRHNCAMQIKATQVKLKRVSIDVLPKPDAVVNGLNIQDIKTEDDLEENLGVEEFNSFNSDSIENDSGSLTPAPDIDDKLENGQINKVSNAEIDDLIRDSAQEVAKKQKESDEDFSPFKVPRSGKCRVKCDMCDYYCADMYHLKRHKDEVHFKKKNIKYLCRLCNFVGRDLYSLKRHTFSKKHTQESKVDFD